MTGTVLAYAGSTAPAGFLFCHGQVVARADHPNLFAVIGTTYNTGGETSAQFRLPDLRAEFIRGLDAGRGIDPGRALGSAQQGTAMPYYAGGGGGGAVTSAAVFHDPAVAYNNPTYTREQSTSTLPGGCDYYETRPRNVAMNYIIKT